MLMSIHLKFGMQYVIEFWTKFFFLSIASLMLNCLSTVVSPTPTELTHSYECVVGVCISCHHSVTTRWLTDCVLWLDPGLPVHGTLALWLVDRQKRSFFWCVTVKSHWKKSSHCRDGTFSFEDFKNASNRKTTFLAVVRMERYLLHPAPTHEWIF